MFYLIWQMGLILLLAFAMGLLFGRQIWSGDARSAEADEALADLERLRRENENLARRLGEAEARETPVASAPVDIEPEKVATPTPPAADNIAPEPAVDGDNLTQIKGLGPKAASALNAAGVSRFAQIADWSDAEIAEWDTKINGRGRIARDNWVGQAKDLA